MTTTISLQIGNINWLVTNWQVSGARFSKISQNLS